MSKLPQEEQQWSRGGERRRCKTSQRTIQHLPCDSKERLRHSEKIEQCESNQTEPHSRNHK